MRTLLSPSCTRGWTQSPAWPAHRWTRRSGEGSRWRRLAQRHHRLLHARPHGGCSAARACVVVTAVAACPSTRARRLLGGFRLPGEAQKIDRIMEKFAEVWLCGCVTV
jgi:hypothetical protein